MSGKYKLTDEVHEKCRCGGTVDFAQNEVFKFCPKCGEKHNKMRFGTSSYTYAGVMSQELARKLGEIGPAFFEFDENSGAAGHRIVFVRKVIFKDASGFIDASKAHVNFTSESVGVEVYTNASGHWSTHLHRRHFGDDFSVGFSDDEIFNMSKDQMMDRIASEMKGHGTGLWSRLTGEEEYELKKNTILNMSILDAESSYSDQRCKAYTPRQRWWGEASETLRNYWNAWIKVEDEARERFANYNFTVVRMYSMKKSIKETGDVVVVTIKSKNRDKKDILITYRDIESGVAPGVRDFDFTAVSEKEIVCEPARTDIWKKVPRGTSV